MAVLRPKTQNVVVTDVERGLQAERMEEKRERSKREFDAKLQDIAILYKERIVFNGGKQDMLSRILHTFLKIGLKIQEIMTTLTSVTKVIELVGYANDFLDGALSYNNLVIDKVNQNEYTWWARFKAKRKYRKARRSIVGKMKGVLDSMMFSYEFGTALEATMVGFDKKLMKMEAKMTKKQAKNGGGVDGNVTTDPEVERFLSSTPDVDGYETAKTTATDNASAPSTTGGTAGGTTGGTSDGGSGSGGFDISGV